MGEALRSFNFRSRQCTTEQQLSLVQEYLNRHGSESKPEALAREQSDLMRSSAILFNITPKYCASSAAISEADEMEKKAAGLK